jgi:hypothetical protein
LIGDLLVRGSQRGRRLERLDQRCQALVHVGRAGQEMQHALVDGQRRGGEQGAIG